VGTWVAQANLAPRRGAELMLFRLPSFIPRLTAAALVFFASASAFGAEPSQPDAPVHDGRWYGWQSMIVDGSAVLLSLPLAARGTNMYLLFGFVGPPAYAVGAPIVHFAHHNVPQGLASLGLRLGAPPLVGGAVSLACNPGTRQSCFVGATLGTAVAAMLIDDVFLAYEHAPSEPTPNHAVLHFQPTFTANAHGAMAGLAVTM